MRDRLIELVMECSTFPPEFKDFARLHAEYVANHLINNGVIVPPCKIGDTVYEIVCDDPFLEDSNLSVVESTVCEFILCTTEEMHNMNTVGKTYFLSREEAEKRVEELRGDTDA